MSGFVYIWRDKKHNRYYVGSHWGSEDDSYVCSSPWMMQAYKHRKNDFKRKILSRIATNRLDLLKEEQRWFDMIKPNEIKVRYYNLSLKTYGAWHVHEESRLSVGQKISKSKTGKNTGPRPIEVGQKISEVKKRKCAERRELTGSSFTEGHRKAISECKTGVKQTEESNVKRSQTLQRKLKSGEIIPHYTPHTEESKKKTSDALMGIKRSDETKNKMSKGQSKKYRIKFSDGSEIVAHGLKTFCRDNRIPYVTARKAFEVSSPIRKYKIESIQLDLP